MPVGNTLDAGSRARSATPRRSRSPPPVAAYEATKMPLPQGRCFGKYTDEARAAGIEGTVVLDLIVGEDGHARDIHVVTGPRARPHRGRDRRAARLPGSRPARRTASPSPVRIRGFKIRFVMEEAL